MIESYASGVGRDLVQGNWAAIAKKRPIEPLDDCYIDLLLLDAATCENDIKKVMEGRLFGPIAGQPNGSYSIHEPPGCSMSYRIDFIWTGNDVKDVNVSFASLPITNEAI